MNFRECLMNLLSVEALEVISQSSQCGSVKKFIRIGCDLKSIISQGEGERGESRQQTFETKFNRSFTRLNFLKPSKGLSTSKTNWK